MLADNLKVLLGSTFAFYVKIHGFHFNIEGDNFPQYHEFLGDFYTEEECFEREYANNWFIQGHKSAFFDKITLIHNGNLTKKDL